jgi:hypothetical protein
MQVLDLQEVLARVQQQVHGVLHHPGLVQEGAAPRPQWPSSSSPLSTRCMHSSHAKMDPRTSLPRIACSLRFRPTFCDEDEADLNDAAGDFTEIGIRDIFFLSTVLGTLSQNRSTVSVLGTMSLITTVSVLGTLSPFRY